MNFILGNEFDSNGFPCFFVYRLANCTKSTFTEFFTNYEIFEAHLKWKYFGRFLLKAEKYWLYSNHFKNIIKWVTAPWIWMINLKSNYKKVKHNYNTYREPFSALILGNSRCTIRYYSQIEAKLTIRFFRKYRSPCTCSMGYLMFWDMRIWTRDCNII